MTDFDIGRLGYLGLLAGVLLLWLFVQNRDRLGKTLQQMAAWGLIFLGTIAAVGLWEDIRTTVRPSSEAVFAGEGRIEVPRASDGHYYVTLEINTVPVRFVVDTGASGMVLTRQDAARAGIEESDMGFHSRAMTANGPVATAPVRLDSVALGPLLDRGLRAYVNDGEMTNSLLGMSYLQRFDRVEISGGRMILQRD